MSDRVSEIRAGELVLTASLNDSETSSDFWDALPISGRAQIWGDEIYFSTSVSADEAADSQETVEIGAVAYWPPGNALCLFRGPTPMSGPGEIRPASAVNVMGQIDGDPTVLGQVRDGTIVVIEQAAE
jgi:hypothetical protein